MTGAFFAAVAALGVAMKLSARVGTDHTSNAPRVMRWIVLAPSSLKRAVHRSSVLGGVWKGLLLIFATLVLILLHRRCAVVLNLPGILLSYLAVPVLYVATEALLALVDLLFLLSGRRLPALHDRPWLSASIAEFWGRRWNLWFSDWFREVVFKPLRRRPNVALVVAFTLSGLMHEWVLSVPLLLLHGESLFGGQMIYFVVQAPAICIERRWLSTKRVLRRLLAWLVVFGLSPFVLNEALLRVLHLWRG